MIKITDKETSRPVRLVEPATNLTHSQVMLRTQRYTYVYVQGQGPMWLYHLLDQVQVSLIQGFRILYRIDSEVFKLKFHICDTACRLYSTNAEVCEVNVDTFLDAFCAHATFTRNSTTTYNSSKVQCPTSTITVTVYRTTETGIYTSYNITMAQYYCRSGNSCVKKLSYDKLSCKKSSVGTTPYHISANSTH